MDEINASSSVGNNEVLVDIINCTNMPFGKVTCDVNEMDISTEEVHKNMPRLVCDASAMDISSEEGKVENVHSNLVRRIEPARKLIRLIESSQLELSDQDQIQEKEIDENVQPTVSKIEKKLEPRPTNIPKPAVGKGRGAKPPRNGVVPRRKCTTIQSSGYGRPRKGSNSSMYKSDSEDDNSVGSARSIRSVRSTSSRGNTRRIAQPRLSHSTPSSPMNSVSISSNRPKQELTRSKSNSSSRSMPPAPSSVKSIMRSDAKLKPSHDDAFALDLESSSWAKKERQKKNERLLRSGLKVGDAIPVEAKLNINNNTKKASLNQNVSDIDKEPATPVERVLFNTNLPQMIRVQNESGDEQRNKSSTMKKARSKLSQWMSPLRSGYSKGVATASDNESIDNSEVSEIKFEVNQIKDSIVELFGIDTGLSNEDVKMVLNKKSTVSKWDVKKKNEGLLERVKSLKETLNSLLIANNKFTKCAQENENSMLSIMTQMKNKIIKLENERKHIKKNTKQLESNVSLLKDNAQGTKNEAMVLSDKNKSMNEELATAKKSLAESERQHTQAKISLAVIEGRLCESLRQSDGWRSEIVMVEAAKADAVKQAETAVSTSMERECSELREECLALKTEKSLREEELCRLLDVSDARSDGQLIVDEIRREIDRLREKASEAESQLNLRDIDLARALSDYEAANARYAAKDRDMSELMKGLSDIQTSGQAREEELKVQKKSVEVKVNEMENELSSLRGEISILQHEKSSLKEIIENIQREKAEILIYKEQCNEHLAALQVEKELRARAEAKELEERNERVAYSSQMVAMTKEHASSEAQLKEATDSQDRHWRERLEAQKNIHSQIEKELLSTREIVTGLEAEKMNLVGALNDKKSMVDAKSIEELGRLTGEVNVLKERLKAADRKVTDVGVNSAGRIKLLEEQLRESHAERRRMHNTIQELRGNVRVFVRVRPFLPGDGVESEAEPCITPKNENSLKIAKSNGESCHHFAFDRVFAPSASQESVFQEVSELVQSALDGYNVCLFSYGQTGSGKTHTMQGSGLGQMRGIIPRAIEQVGSYKETLELEGWRYSMKVSFLEIYNESIRDLLRDENSEELKHEIKVDSQGRRIVTDLTLKPLEPTNLNEIEEVMRLASKHRSVASTDMNSVSSRSHSIFTLHLTAVHNDQRQSIRGTLNLVDLAGSERLNRSGAVGQRAKEAMSINKSLSSLTDVFVSIGKKASHIPFRNSKLTYLLQPSLSGNGKTLMIANVSPTEESIQETVCALRFASNVNKCELGKPKRSIEEVNNVGVDEGKKVCSQKRRV